MTADAKPVSITILDKEYLISCTERERQHLYTAVEFLNKKIHEVKESGNIIGTERIAVMAALNIANELLAYKHENDDYTSKIDDTLQRLQSKINDALIQGKQLEI